MPTENLLIIEDDDISTMLLSYMIKDVFDTDAVTVKENGEKALAYLESLSSTPEEFPHLIFLDLNMPYLSGYDFMELYESRFASRYPDTQLVVLTSSVRKKDKDLALAYPSVAGFFNKPLPEEQLIRIRDNMNYKVQ